MQLSKSPENRCLEPDNCQNDPNPYLTFEVKNNSQSISEQLQTKLQKVKKDSFCLKNDQFTGNNFGKSVKLFVFLGPKSLKMTSKVL